MGIEPTHPFLGVHRVWSPGGAPAPSRLLF